MRGPLWPNMQCAKRLDEATILLHFHWLLLIRSRQAYYRLKCEHQEHRRRAGFQSLSLCTSLANSALSSSRSSLRGLCSFVTSFIVPSTTKACGYLRCISASLAMISSRDRASIVFTCSRRSTVRPPKADRIFSALMAAENDPASSAAWDSLCSRSSCPDHGHTVTALALLSKFGDVFQNMRVIATV
jgi:hypothetical protein